MNIALIGYGKMGKAIEEIAVTRGHQIVLRIGQDNRNDMTMEALKKADVCIEFTTPHAAFENVADCLKAGIPTICGSTGWLEKLPDAHELCAAHQTAFLYASNFSIGVNLFFSINRIVADMMQDYPQYKVDMEEIHHTQKKDAPSGTAVTLAEDILRIHRNMERWVNSSDAADNELSIVSKRIDPAPGTHSINYHSDIDDITITHTAHSRKGFAAGAVAASEFIVGKQGLFTMNDLLSL